MITIEMKSLRRAPAATTIAVVLPTFRRPEHLAKTLASLCAQATDRTFAVVVVENDAEGREGVAVAMPFLAEGRIDGVVITAHERGNCSAYNAGLQTALATFSGLEFCLVIDDDECASECWIEHLIAAAGALGSDIVGGPQRPVFEDVGAAALVRHPVFTPHYKETGAVPILYSSGNVLLGRRVLDAMGPVFFDPAFNFAGGGDSDFYSRCREQGFSFGWCVEAPVFESLPKRRTEFSWIHARSLRNGALSRMIEQRRDASASGRVRAFAKSLALLAAAPLRGVLLGWRTRSGLIGLYHLQVAIGRLQGEFGWVHEQYRKPEQN